jgi:hypothetical protein
VFLQITRTIPLRRTILQFSQIRLTLARTFISHHPDKKRFVTFESEIIATKSICLKLGGKE